MVWRKGKKIDQKFGGKTIQTRIRDHISNSHATLVTETTGQGFLTIVRKEAKHHMPSPASQAYEYKFSSLKNRNYGEQNFAGEFQEEGSPENQRMNEGATDGVYDINWNPENGLDTETDPVQRAKNFYPISNVFDTSDLNG